MVSAPERDLCLRHTGTVNLSQFDEVDHNWPDPRRPVALMYRLLSFPTLHFWCPPTLRFLVLYYYIPTYVACYHHMKFSFDVKTELTYSRNIWIWVGHIWGRANESSFISNGSGSFLWFKDRRGGVFVTWQVNKTSQYLVQKIMRKRGKELDSIENHILIPDPLPMLIFSLGLIS